MTLGKKLLELMGTLAFDNTSDPRKNQSTEDALTKTKSHQYNHQSKKH